MHIVDPDAPAVNSISATDEQRTFVRLFLSILTQHPQDKLLYIAAVICFLSIGLTQVAVATLCGCTDRHIRYLRDKWRDGGGLTAFVPRQLGRPLKATAAVVGFLVLILWDLRPQSRSRITYSQLKAELAARHQVNLGESTIRALITQEYGLEVLLEAPTPAPSPSADEGEVICHSSYAGAWLLVPILHRMRLWRLTRLLSYAGQHVIRPFSFVMTVLVTFLIGHVRLGHLVDLCDRGLALLTGLRWVMDASTAYRLLHDLTPESVRKFYLATAAQENQLAGQELETISVDGHAAPTETQAPLGRTKIPTRGRKMKAHGLFSSFNLLARRFVGLHVADGGRQLSQELLPSMADLDQVKQVAGQLDRSRLNIMDRGAYSGRVYAALLGFKERLDMDFLGLARRTKKNVKQWDQNLTGQGLRPYVHHKDLPLSVADRRTHFGLLTCWTKIKDCTQKIWTVLIVDKQKLNDPDPKAKYMAALFSSLVDLPAHLVAYLYPYHWRHEWGHRNLMSLGLDALPHRWSAPTTEPPTELATTGSMTEGSSFVMMQKELPVNWKEVFFLTWQRMLAHNWVAALAEAIGGVYSRMTVARIVRKFIIRPGTLLLKGDELWVLLEPFPDQAALTNYLEWVNRQRLRLPWLNNLVLQIAVSAHQPTGPPMREAQMRKRLFAG
jgi:hypothetical protein